ncbi:MAG: hypothetical protein U9O56_02275 [Campylobacterota bacterium]|nr:hypothetical protein [Campylobacterota bacterium]
MSTEIRKLPKKTFIYIGILVILGIASFFIVANGKAVKATKILNTLGYKNVADVKVYASHEFLREDINVKGYKHTISFTNLETSQFCKGFVLKDFRGNVEKDLICKKIGQ